MYAFFIDDWTAQKKYQREVDGLDLMLTQRSLVGRKIKLNRLHDLDSSVREQLAEGVKTLVAVGNDATVSRLLNSLLKLEPGQIRQIALAVLPIGPEQSVARSLGCGVSQEAVNALAQGERVLIDLGKLNNRHYFITAAVFPPRVSLGFLSYTVSSLRREHQISVCNTNIYEAIAGKTTRAGFHPGDGTLEAVIAYAPGKSFWSKLFSRQVLGDYVIESVFPHKKITILAKEKTISVRADTEKRLSTPVEVEIVPGALAVVVGNKKIF